MHGVNTGGAEEGRCTLPQIEGKRVLVVGGGHTAIDCARSSVRLGAKAVEMVCLETKETMPADPQEVAEAETEGIMIHPTRAVGQIVTKDGRVTGVECLNVNPSTSSGRCSLELTPDGQLNLETEPGSEHVLEAEVLIVAIGQCLALGPLFDDKGLKRTGRGTVAVDPETLATGRPGLFAAGDCVTGPLNVVDAIAAGRQAAAAINRHLRDHSPTSDLQLPTSTPQLPSPNLQPPAEIPRHPMPTLPLEERLDLNNEVELGYTEEQARLEAQRCYQCGFNVFIEAERCTLCNKCVEVCPQKCLEIIAFDRVENDDELPGMEIAREWLDGGAVFIDETLCSRCNKCVEVCPPLCMRIEQGQ